MSDPVLVTGAAGFIGFSLAQRLLRSGRRGRRRRQPQRLLRSGAQGGPAGGTRPVHGFAFHRLDLADRAGVRGAVRHRHLRPRGPPRRPGRRALLAGEPARLSRCQSRRFPERAGRLPATRRPASRLRLVELGLRRQHRGPLLRAPSRRSPGQPLRRDQAGQRADGPFLCLALQDPDDGPALLHGLRAVGPPRHGAVDLRQGDRVRRAHPALQPRPHAARFHLYRRCRRRHGAADRAAAGRRSRLGRRRAGPGDQRRALAGLQYRRQPGGRGHPVRRTARTGLRPHRHPRIPADAARRRARDLRRRGRSRRRRGPPAGDPDRGGCAPLRRLVSAITTGSPRHGADRGRDGTAGRHGARSRDGRVSPRRRRADRHPPDRPAFFRSSTSTSRRRSTGTGRAISPSAISPSRRSSHGSMRCPALPAAPRPKPASARRRRSSISAPACSSSSPRRIFTAPGPRCGPGSSAPWRRGCRSRRAS